MIPSQAVIPQARDKKVILSKNGKATFVKVKTGVRKESTVEIIEGISIGDTVVTTGLLFIRPDFDLKFSKITN
jgi:membrane fusion protein (multidrug efflux system)